MNTRINLPSRSPSPRRWLAAMVALVVGLQSGCTREFFREWANQDVTEAIFEKSRDPRWRLDMFSIDPPALSRFADPYDPDVPPAPPDDYAAQALSPVPQWPDHRLIMPVEGTGYLDMLESWRPKNAPPPVPPEEDTAEAAAAAVRPATPGAPPMVPPPVGPDPFSTGAAPPAAGAPGDTPPTTPPPVNPLNTPPPVNPLNTPPPGSPLNTPPPGNPLNTPPTGSPLNTPPPRSPLNTPPTLPVPNPGPSPRAMSPIPLPGSSTSTPPNPSPGRAQVNRGSEDAAVRRTSYQETTPAVPPAPPAALPPNAPASSNPEIESIPGRPVPPQADPTLRDLTAPVTPRRDLTPEQYRASEAVGAEMSGLLNFGDIQFNVTQEAGLNKSDTPYILTIDQAFRLAMINSRIYQFNLENVYIASLAVTLQRFAFQPQFYAGMSPSTAPIGAGFAGGLNPPNRFFYSTRATGTPASTLSIGTVAGVGKAFSAGGKLLMGFANQVAFNFIGKNSIQPSVNSFLPLSFVQPFLAGGGRAVTLEALTSAERALLYQIRDFALFRQQFAVALLVGGNIPNFGSNLASLSFTGGGNADPTPGFINILEDIQIVENQRRNVAVFAQLYRVFSELKNGESSGLTQLQVDQISQNLASARGNYFQSRVTFRNDLDSFKQQMGLPPDTPIIPDRGLTRRFKDAFDAVDKWGLDPKRNLEDLPKFAESLPVLEDVVIDGRSFQKLIQKESDSIDGTYNYERNLEDLLLTAERAALEHRLDLMNTRAQLYDAWRQIRVSANALKGVFNVTLTNQFLTPPTTTNPFAFVSQAKQFSLVLNAELPLVRLEQRNNFRQQLINYQRQRRALQNAEDSLKLLIRSDVRGLLLTYLNYQIAKRNFVLYARLKDQAFEQIIAPPQAGAAGNIALAATQTQNLVGAQSGLINTENALVTTWFQYQAARLALYRDLGTLPYDEWEAYNVLFPPDSRGGNNAYSASRGEGFTRATAANPTQVGRR